ncbi:MAG: carbohydrate ABC transporter permease [Firmicutes bacterium]|nr:carbohydrate ABC transporter permease [Bacillota bacterium]
MKIYQTHRLFQKEIGKVFRFVIILLFAILVALPFFWMISSSLKKPLEIFEVPIVWLPAKPQWSNYTEAWVQAPFSKYMFNSIFVSTSIIIGQFFTVILAAYAFARLTFPGKNLLFLSVLSLMMVRLEVRIIPVYLMVSNFGWIDSYYGLIIPMLTSPFGIFLVRQAFMQIPQDLLDAVKIDGGSHLTIIRHVMIPLSVPTIITFMVFGFISHYNSYFYPLIVTHSDRFRTIPIGLSRFKMASETGGVPWHYLMAASAIALIPSVIVFLFSQKYFVRGVASTGIKG